MAIANYCFNFGPISTTAPLQTLCQMWYDTHQRGGNMQTLQEFIKLNLRPCFKDMYYGEDLCNLLETNPIETCILDRGTQIPLSDQISNSEELNRCFENQWMTIPLLNKPAIVTCNPFHRSLPPTIDQMTVYLTDTKTFIYYLAHQLGESPVIGCFELLHFFASKHGLSDIHIEPNNDTINIIFRKIKHHVLTIPISKSIGDRLISYVKLKSHMDISIRQHPQEGHYHYNYSTSVFDIRSSTLPIHYGEALSLRLFSTKPPALTFASLGFSKEKVNYLDEMINKPNGLILITGATGSGKSTTLYTMLQALQKKKKHITTLEDPIEQVIPNIWQTTIDVCISFEHGFKSLLRHAPDVIGIGEIRDKQTAALVLNAAFSGHLVIASMHTNGIKATLLRLHSLGCDSFLISYCLRGIISQTLIPKNHHELQLNSELLIVNSDHYMTDLKHELTDYINNNTLVT